MAMRQPFGRGEAQATKLKKSKKVKLPEIYSTKFDIKKIKLPPVKAWAMQRITEITGNDDEIALALLDDVLDTTKPNPADLEFTLAGVLPADRCRPFVEELWKILVSAAGSPDGIAPEISHVKPPEAVSEVALSGAEVAKAAALAASQKLKEQFAARVSQGTSGNRGDANTERKEARTYGNREQRQGRSHSSSPVRRRRSSTSPSPRPLPRSPRTTVDSGRRRSPHRSRSRSPRRHREHRRAISPRRERSPAPEREFGRRNKYGREAGTRGRSRSPPSRRNRSPKRYQRRRSPESARDNGRSPLRRRKSRQSSPSRRRSNSPLDRPACRSPPAASDHRESRSPVPRRDADSITGRVYQEHVTELDGRQQDTKKFPALNEARNNKGSRGADFSPSPAGSPARTPGLTPTPDRSGE